MEAWTLVAIPVVSALTGLITAGVVMAVGGLGVLRALHRRLLLAEERIEDTDSRITREVKRRASIAAQDAKRTSPEQEAAAYLKEHGAKDQTPSQRPSLVRR